MFGDKLRRFRKENKLTQEQLGSMVGVTGAYIQQLEKGIKNNPSLELVMKLCTALHIAPFDLDIDPSSDDLYSYIDSRLNYVNEIDKKVELNKNATIEKNGDFITVRHSKEYMDNYHHLEELSKKYLNSLIEHETSKLEGEEEFFSLVLSWLPWDDLDNLTQEQVIEIVKAITLMYKFKLYEFTQANEINS